MQQASKASNETFCNERAFKKLHHLPMCSVHCLKADASAERSFLTQSQFDFFKSLKPFTKGLLLAKKVLSFAHGDSPALFTHEINFFLDKN